MRSSCTLKESTWSMKGLLLGWFLGVLKVLMNSSLSRRRWVLVEKALSKDKRGLENLRQLPVSLSSSLVWMLLTKNLAEGPFGDLASHIKRSFCLCYSKNMKLLQERSKQISSTTFFASLRFTFDSLFVFATRLSKSCTRCLNRPAMPREATTRVRCRFFHSFDCGSGSLKALRSFSGSRSMISGSAVVSSFCSSSSELWFSSSSRLGFVI